MKIFMLRAKAHFKVKIMCRVDVHFSTKRRNERRENWANNKFDERRNVKPRNEKRKNESILVVALSQRNSQLIESKVCVSLGRQMTFALHLIASQKNAHINELKTRILCEKRLNRSVRILRRMSWKWYLIKWRTNCTMFSIKLSTKC